MESAFTRQSAAFQVPDFTGVGYNYKLSDILAAIAIVQLGKLEQFTQRRQALAARYGQLLAEIPGILAPDVPDDRTSTWQTYAVTVQEPLSRDAILVALREQGIGCNIGTYALHRQPVYGADAGPCPVSNRLFERHLALPLFTDLTEAEQDRVVEILAKVVYSQ